MLYLIASPHPQPIVCLLLFLISYLLILGIKIFKIYLFILAALGLHGCLKAFSSCSDQGLLSFQCMGFSLRWLFFLSNVGSRACEFQQLWLSDSTVWAW